MIFLRSTLTNGDYSIRLEYVRKDDMVIFHLMYQGVEKECVHLRIDRPYYREPERVQRLVDGYAERYLNSLIQRA